MFRLQLWYLVKFPEAKTSAQQKKTFPNIRMLPKLTIFRQDFDTGADLEGLGI